MLYLHPPSKFKIYNMRERERERDSLYKFTPYSGEKDS